MIEKDKLEVFKRPDKYQPDNFVSKSHFQKVNNELIYLT